MKKNTFPVQYRNKKLREFIKTIFSDQYQIEFVGNQHQPKIVITNDEIEYRLVNGFVKNFMYHFTTKHYGGEITESYDFSNEQYVEKFDFSCSNIVEYYTQKIHLLRLNGTNLFLSNNLTEPIFSPLKRRYFFTIEDAKRTQIDLLETYSLECRIE